MDSVQDNKDTSRISRFLSSLGIEEKKSKIILFFLLFVVFFSATISFLLLPPINFPSNTIIIIESGTSLQSVSKMLYQTDIIRSPWIFKICARVIGGEKPVAAGEYLFKGPAPACVIAMRIANGISGVPQVRVTIPEGMSNVEMAVVFEKNIKNFDRNAFFETLWSKEGFLFPDTYFFSGNVTVETIGEAMLSNFNRKIEPLQSEIDASGRTLSDIVIMASILEKEVATDSDRKMVSGILWKRIEMGMPLQVDATFMYLLGKKSSELTLGDLQMKDPYNTYVNKGLPYGPIGNPGIEAIKAAIHPTVSPYLYYLSDKEGVMHYAKTFAEHKANKAKYLK
ncbi:MAG: endolytic transglycosylase MltG [Candidatus Paceibacterota bacterium]|jgi:UPF0755 protein